MMPRDWPPFSLAGLGRATRWGIGILATLAAMLLVIGGWLLLWPFDPMTAGDTGIAVARALGGSIIVIGIMMTVGVLTLVTVLGFRGAVTGRTD